MNNLSKQLKIAAMIVLSGLIFPIFAMRESMQRELNFAAEKGNYDQVVALVKEGASKEDMGSALNRVLHVKPSAEANKIANYLVSMGANVNIALESAAHDGNIQLCRVLIEHGADADIAYQHSIDQNRSIRSSSLFNAPFYSAIPINQKKLVIETLITTISKKEREEIEQSRRGIITGLMVVNRGQPRPPLDVQKIIAGKIIAPFIDKHMAYAKKQLDDLVNLSESEESPWIESSYVLNVINPIKEPANWQRLRKIVEANVRRILFAV